MRIVHLGGFNSILNQFVAELRDIKIQKDQMRFRRNTERIGEIMAYEISKSLSYYTQNIQTPLGISPMSLIKDQLVLGTILRAGIPFHKGFLNYFDNAENAFVSAYRIHNKEAGLEVPVEYIASPPLTGKTLILSDPMMATGNSMEMAYKSLLSKGEPAEIHIAAIITCRQALRHIQEELPHENTTVWIAALDDDLNDDLYIVPGIGDVGDLSFGGRV